MNWKISYAKKALQDLDGIYEYISKVLIEPVIAQNLVTIIMKEIGGLETLPMRHHLFDEEPLKSQGLRIMPVKNYLVAYIPKEDEHTVYIIRIMYGGRDISKQLNDID